MDENITTTTYDANSNVISEKELVDMKKNGEITDKTLTQIRKAFQGRDLASRGKNK